jgi:hypothetical protein
MKLNSTGALTLGTRPLGKDGQFSVARRKVLSIIRKRRGLLEDLTSEIPRKGR